MKNITFDEFRKLPEYQDFEKENPSFGLLKIQVFTADQAIPLPDVEIFVTREYGDYNITFFKGVTDSSGIVDNIHLPSPGGDYNIETQEIPKYALYDISACCERLNTIKKYKVEIYSGVKIVQYVKMNKEGVI